jgi:hypothetical protein
MGGKNKEGITGVAIPFEVGQVSTEKRMWNEILFRVAIPFEVGQVSTKRRWKDEEKGCRSQSLLK